MSNIDYYVNRAIEEIKSESVYRQYTTSLEKLNANPEIKRQVDELRRLNYQAQIKNDDADSYDTIDDIDDKIDELFYHPIPVAIALIVVGIVFIVVENAKKGSRPAIRSIGEITYKAAIIIGLFQLIAAVFPGTSRSGATIIGALIIGVSRSVAAEFTFFLAVPVMFGASLLKIAKYAAVGMAMTGTEWVVLIVGCLVAFFVSVFVIKFLMGYIKKHDFKVFGVYRIILGIAVIALSFVLF